MKKDPKDITFLDVFEAVEAVGNDELFHFHEDPNPNCPVGANIHAMLDDKLYEIQKVMEDKMAEITLADILNTPGISLNA